MIEGYEHIAIMNSDELIKILEVELKIQGVQKDKTEIVTE